MPDAKYLKRWKEVWALTDRVYSAFMKNMGLTGNEYLILEHLYEHEEGAEPAVLAETARIQRQMTTFILRTFEEHGWIEREENKQDHRRKTIRLTARGREFAADCCHAVGALDEAGLAVFSAAEQRQHLDYSTRFYEAIQKASCTIRAKQLGKGE